MPDENKLAKLREIGFKSPLVCDLCVHGQFKPGTNFGTCQKFTYEHQKHTGAPRQLSIHRGGCCYHHELDQTKLEPLRKSGFLDL